MPGIREIIEEFIEKTINKEKFYSLYGTVKSVDEAARTCVVDPIGDEAERSEVRLQGDIGAVTGVVLIPKVGSVVGITFVNDTAAFVSLYTEVDKVLIDTATAVFNGGDNGGLINITDLITKLNNVEKDLNIIKGIFISWTPVANDGGAVLKGLATASWAGDTLTPTIKGDLEDTKVTH